MSYRLNIKTLTNELLHLQLLQANPVHHHHLRKDGTFHIINKSKSDILHRQCMTRHTVKLQLSNAKAENTFDDSLTTHA